MVVEKLNFLRHEFHEYARISMYFFPYHNLIRVAVKSLITKDFTKSTKELGMRNYLLFQQFLIPNLDKPEPKRDLY